jgi:uncharacterized protein YprB with RNaseH-like and TPR domain
VPYHQHPACFLKEINGEPKIATFDIETVLGFNADAGYMICYVLKEYHKNKYHIGYLVKKDVTSFRYDENIIHKLVDDMKKFNVLLTFNGTRFDIPYARTRCMQKMMPFPEYGYIKHIDIYYLVKYKMKLRSSSLANATRFLKIDGKTHVDIELWWRAQNGDAKAIAEVVSHCKHDTRITEKLYDRIIEYSRRSNRSI